MLSEKVFETLNLMNPMKEESNFGCINYPEAILYFNEVI